MTTNVVSRVVKLGCVAICSLQFSIFAEDLSFMMWSTGTFFTISGSGRVDVQFGSTAGDHAFLPEGSVDVDLLRALLPHASTEAASTIREIAIGDETRSRSFQEAGVIMYAICSKQREWRPDPMGAEHRVRKLLEERVISRCQKLRNIAS